MKSFEYYNYYLKKYCKQYNPKYTVHLIKNFTFISNSDKSFFTGYKYSTASLKSYPPTTTRRKKKALWGSIMLYVA